MGTKYSLEDEHSLKDRGVLDHNGNKRAAERLHSVPGHDVGYGYSLSARMEYTRMLSLRYPVIASRPIYATIVATKVFARLRKTRLIDGSSERQGGR